MKKLFKITSLVLAGLLFVSLIFGAGVYANDQGWLKFKDKQVSDADDNLGRIMEILRDLNTQLENSPKDQTELVSQLQTEIKDLKTQIENAPEDQTELVSDLREKIEKLEKERPSGLAKENQDLREELRKANEAVTDHNSETKKALTEAQGYVDEE